MLQYCLCCLCSGILAIWHVTLSSLTMDWTCTPSIGRQNLNHWTAREIPALGILIWTLTLCQSPRKPYWERGSLWEPDSFRLTKHTGLLDFPLVYTHHCWHCIGHSPYTRLLHRLILPFKVGIILTQIIVEESEAELVKEWTKVVTGMESDTVEMQIHVGLTSKLKCRGEDQPTCQSSCTAAAPPPPPSHTLSNGYMCVSLGTMFIEDRHCMLLGVYIPFAWTHSHTL